jgi:hypothetical protein
MVPIYLIPGIRTLESQETQTNGKLKAQTPTGNEINRYQPTAKEKNRGRHDHPQGVRVQTGTEEQ